MAPAHPVLLCLVQEREKTLLKQKVKAARRKFSALKLQERAAAALEKEVVTTTSSTSCSSKVRTIPLLLMLQVWGGG